MADVHLRSMREVGAARWLALGGLAPAEPSYTLPSPSLGPPWLSASPSLPPPMCGGGGGGGGGGACMCGGGGGGAGGGVNAWNVMRGAVTGGDVVTGAITCGTVTGCAVVGGVVVGGVVVGGGGGIVVVVGGGGGVVCTGWTLAAGFELNVAPPHAAAVSATTAVPAARYMLRRAGSILCSCGVCRNRCMWPVLRPHHA